MKKLEKRSVCITVRMMPTEFAAIKKAAQKRWPGLNGLMTRSNTVRSLALIAAKPDPEGGMMP